MLHVPKKNFFKGNIFNYQAVFHLLMLLLMKFLLINRSFFVVKFLQFAVIYLTANHKLSIRKISQRMVN